MSWDDIPTSDEVKDALDRVARLRAQLRVAELELEIAQAEISQIAPRNRAARIIGVDAESREKLQGLLYAVTNARALLEEAEADVSFNTHRINMAKSLNYRRF